MCEKELRALPGGSSGALYAPEMCEGFLIDKKALFKLPALSSFGSAHRSKPLLESCLLATVVGWTSASLVRQKGLLAAPQRLQGLSSLITANTGHPTSCAFPRRHAVKGGFSADKYSFSRSNAGRDRLTHPNMVRCSRSLLGPKMDNFCFREDVIVNCPGLRWLLIAI